MTVVIALLVGLFVLSGVAVVWRVVTMPMRLARSVQRLSGAVRQRQADKAAGKPVAPISLLAFAGLALAIGGLIVARTTSAIYGFGLMVIGMGVILIGSKMADAKWKSIHQSGYPQRQSGWAPGQAGDVSHGQFHDDGFDGGIGDTLDGRRTQAPGPRYNPAQPRNGVANGPPPQAGHVSDDPTGYSAAGTSRNWGTDTSSTPTRPNSTLILIGIGAAVVVTVLAAVAINTAADWNRHQAPNSGTRYTGGVNAVPGPDTPSTGSQFDTPATTMTAESRSAILGVSGTDGRGFVGHSARCDVGSTPAAAIRTAQSLAIVCQSSPGSYYYRGERLSDGAGLQLSGAVLADGGFDVTNPADGALYQVRPQMLTIISNGHVDSAEPALEYGSSAG